MYQFGQKGMIIKSVRKFVIFSRDSDLTSSPRDDGGLVGDYVGDLVVLHAGVRLYSLATAQLG